VFKKIDIIFFVEHKDRELNSIMLMTKLLNKKYGYKSIILPMHFSLFWLLIYKPRVVASYFIQSEKTFPVAFIRKIFPKSRFISMNWEQLLSPVNLIYKKVSDDFSKKQVSHLSWSNNYKEYLIDAGVSEHNIHVTGCLPLSEPMVREYGENTSALIGKYNLHKYEKIIFFPLNLAWALLSSRELSFRMRRGYDSEVLEEHYSLANDTKKIILKWISKASKNNPNYIFIVRPHPNISTTQCHNEFAFDQELRENVVITKEFSAYDWLFVSNKNYSNWSTVIHDSIVMGHHGCLLKPLPRPKWLNVLWNDRVENISNYEEFEQSLHLANSSHLKSDFPNISVPSQEIEALSLSFFNSVISNSPVNVYVSYKKVDRTMLKECLRSFANDFLCRYFNCYKVDKGQATDFFNLKKKL
jgi:hypothetical protein